MKYGDMRALLEAFVEHNREKPVFIYIHAMEPHIPYETPRDTSVYSTGYDENLLEKLYQSFHKSPPYPSLENPTEEELGAVRNLYRDAVLRGHTFFEETKNYLETSGALDEASLLILSSDHGERFYEHRSWIHGPPDVYNEVLRIPLMMAGPGINPGVYEENVQLLDIYPTLLDWMGEDIFAYFPGRSLLSIIGEALAAGTGDETGGDAGTSDLRPIYADGTGAQGQYAVFWNGLKVIVDGSAVEVYDLRKDPDKTQNRASDRRYQRYIKEARIFQAKFRREGQGKQRGLSAEEKERLKILGYIK
jgi:arylsulfatase A-like enzyme